MAKQNSFQLSPDDEGFVLDKMRRLWDYIGYDALQALSEMGGKRSTYSAAEVREMVLDAGRLEEEIKRGRQTSPAVVRLMDNWYDDDNARTYIHALAKKAFPTGRYGM